MQDLSFRHALIIDFTEVPLSGPLGLQIKFAETTTGSLGSIGVNFIESPATGILSVSIKFQQTVTGPLSLSVNFIEFSPDVQVRRRFSAKVMLNNVDVSSQILGTITVQATESEATTAEFTLKPGAGAIDPYAWINNPVTIAYLQINSAGVVTGTFRKFTGIVHTPDYDVTTGLTHFTCSDNLQEVFEFSSRAAIDSILGGFTDSDIIGTATDNWSYAQAQLSTLPVSFDKDYNGTARITPWQPKSVADLSFDQTNVIDESLDITLAERRNIVNKVDLTFTGRQARKWQRDLRLSWGGLVYSSFTEYLSKSYPLPLRTTILQALEGWTLKDISFSGLPQSRLFPTLGGGFIGWILTDYAKTLAMGFHATISKRWLQTTESIYSLSVQNSASIVKHGQLATTESFSSEVTDSSNFEVYPTYKTPTGTPVGSTDYVSNINVSWDNKIQAAIAKIRNVILASHRKNFVSFSTPMVAAISTDMTVQINTTNLTAKGKIHKITEEIDTLGGSALTTVTLALYLPNAAGQVDSGLTPPTDPVASPTSSIPGSAPLETHVGNRLGVGAEDPTWQGWVTNQDTLITIGFVPAPQIYNERFTITLPAVDPQDRDTVSKTVTSTIEVALPQDTLTLGA